MRRSWILSVLPVLALALPSGGLGRARRARRMSAD